MVFGEQRELKEAAGLFFDDVLVITGGVERSSFWWKASSAT